jgi:hypothetical protein
MGYRIRCTPNIDPPPEFNLSGFRLEAKKPPSHKKRFLVFLFEAWQGVDFK